MGLLGQLGERDRDVEQLLDPAQQRQRRLRGRAAAGVVRHRRPQRGGPVPQGDARAGSRCLDITIPLAELPSWPGVGARRGQVGRERGARWASTCGRWRRPRTPPTYRGHREATALTGVDSPAPARDEPPRCDARPGGGQTRTPRSASSARPSTPGAPGSSPLAGPSLPRARLGVGPRVDGGQRAGVSRSSARRRADRRRATGSAPGPPWRGDGLRASGPAAASASASRRRSTPGRCGSGGRAAPAGSPSGRRRRARSRETKTRLPLRLATSSRRPGRSCRRARSAGRTATRRSATSACAADTRGAGRRRSLPPPCTSIADRRGGPSAIAAHSMCQPGRPGPSGRRPRPARRRGRRHSSGSSGSRLPARSGSPPRSAKSSSIAAAVQVATRSRTAGRRRQGSRRRRRRRTTAPRGLAAARRSSDDRAGSTRPRRRSASRRQDRSASMSSRNSAVSRIGEHRPVLAVARRRAPAAGRRCR